MRTINLLKVEVWEPALELWDLSPSSNKEREYRIYTCEEIYVLLSAETETTSLCDMNLPLILLH